MDWSIYCFGNDSANIFYYVLSFLHTISESYDFPEIFSISVLVGFMFLSLEGIASFSPKRIMYWVLTFFLTLSVLLKIQVTCSMKQVNFSPIENVVPARHKIPAPIGVVAPLSILTNINYRLGLAISKSFPVTPASSQGFLEPLRVAQDVMNKNKLDPIVARNFKSFSRSCILKDIGTGFYDLEALVNTSLADDFDSLKSFFKENSSRTRRSEVVKYTDGSASYEYPKCNSALGIILDPKKSANSSDLFASLSPLSDYFQQSSISSIGDGFKKTLNTSLIRNYLVAGLEGASLDQNNSLIYAQIKGDTSQRNYFVVSGMFMSKWLPSLHTILLAVFAASFPIIVLCTAFPGGIAVLKNYFFTFAWITSWYPLFVLVHMIILHLASSVLSPQEGVSTILQVASTENKISDLLAMSGYIISLIPMLSIALVKGAGQAMGLSHAITGAVNQSAGTVSEEITTGNISLGNVSLNNMSQNNSSSYSDNFGKISTGIQTDVADSRKDSGSNYYFTEDGSVTKQHHMPQRRDFGGISEQKTTSDNVSMNQSKIDQSSSSSNSGINVASSATLGLGGSGGGGSGGGIISKMFSALNVIGADISAGGNIGSQKVDSFSNNASKDSSKSLLDSLSHQTSSPEQYEILGKLEQLYNENGLPVKDAVKQHNQVWQEYFQQERELQGKYDLYGNSQLDKSVLNALHDGEFKKAFTNALNKLPFIGESSPSQSESMDEFFEGYKKMQKRREELKSLDAFIPPEIKEKEGA